MKLVAPGEEVWRGLSTITGSWIGGGAIQTAIKEIYHCSDSIFSTLIIIDVIVANIWMGFLLYGAGISDKIDKKLKADNSAIEALKTRIENYRSKNERISSTTDIFVIIGNAFEATALAHWGADVVSIRMQNHIVILNKYNLNSLFFDFF